MASSPSAAHKWGLAVRPLTSLRSLRRSASLHATPSHLPDVEGHLAVLEIFQVDLLVVVPIFVFAGTGPMFISVALCSWLNPCSS